MIVEFDEREGGTGITLTPETLEEAAQLMRFSANCKRDPPDIYLSYYNEIYCSIWMNKRKDRINSITNQGK